MIPILIFIAVAIFPVVVTVAACYDLLTMTIPNAVSLVLLASFIALVLLLGPGFGVVGWHLAVGFGVLALTFTLFAFGFIGGGDAKLAAAIALWLGPGEMAEFLVFTALFGGALSIAILVFRAFPLPLFAMRHEWIARLHEPRGDIPYGLALAAGAMMAFPATPWFLALAR